MPVSLTSRYYGLPIYQATDAEGIAHPTIGIRLTAEPDPNAVINRHVMVGVENLEYLAWRYYGSSKAWWRIADANSLVFPLDWPAGAALAMPSPGDTGRIERDRSF